MQMSHISSEKGPWGPKKMDNVANNAAGSANELLYEPKKVDQVAKAYVDSSQNSASKPGNMDPKSKRKPNLTISPPYDPKKMDPVAKLVSDSPKNYGRIPSPRTPGKSELPTTSTGMTTGAKGTSSFTNNGQGIGNSSRSDSLESSTTPLRPHTGGDVRWDAINMVSKGSPLNLSHFRLLNRLGYGDIGSVYLVELRGTKAYFAMKVMDKASLASRNKLLRAQTEREILGLLDHPFLPTLYSYFETEKFYCLVMEFCSGGNLHSLRQKQPNKHFTEEAARLVLTTYLHFLCIL
jgi:hypothetical protein